MQLCQHQGPFDVCARSGLAVLAIVSLAFLPSAWAADVIAPPLKEIPSADWRVTCAPHHNHQDTAEYEVATQLWFDRYLKGAFTSPEI